MIAPGEAVFCVHASGQGAAGSVEVIFRTEKDARRYAADRSKDWRITSASVTRFLIGQLGTRHPVAWYVTGAEQPQWFDRQLYPTDGSRSPCACGAGGRFG